MTKGSVVQSLSHRCTKLIVGMILCLISGCLCLPATRTKEFVAENLATRFGQHSKPSALGEVVDPKPLLSDGLTEDEAIYLALCNNAAFQELLADLGIAHGDMVQAGCFPIPSLFTLLG